MHLLEELLDTRTLEFLSTLRESVSGGGAQESVFNTLFRQFLFPRKIEGQQTKNGPKVIHIISCPLKKNKGLSSDSEPQELKFDACLKPGREVFVSILFQGERVMGWGQGG